MHGLKRLLLNTATLLSLTALFLVACVHWAWIHDDDRLAKIYAADQILATIRAHCDKGRCEPQVYWDRLGHTFLRIKTELENPRIMHPWLRTQLPWKNVSDKFPYE